MRESRTRTAVDWDDAEERSLLPFLRRIHREFIARSGRWGIPLGVHMTMVHLFRHPEDGQPAALADAVRAPRQTMTFIVDFLERRKLVVRLPCPGDRRRRIVRLTARGRAMAEAMFEDLIRFEAAARESIAVGRRDAFRAELGRYADALARQNEKISAADR